MLTNNSAEHEAWRAMVEEVAMEECKNKTEKGFFGFLKTLDKELEALGESNCPGSVVEEISKFGAKLENLKTIAERMLENGDYFDETIREAIEILTGEINQISSMTERAKDVSKNVDEYPTEYLREYQTLKTPFLNGLDDLKNASEKF